MPVLIPAPHPGRSCTREDTLDLAEPLVWTVEAFLTPAECTSLIERFEALGCGPAPISTGSGFRMEPDVRNNSRVIFDDPPLADDLDRKVRPHVPSRMFGVMAPAAICVNERFRGYRYEPSQRFASHFDGSFRRNEQEESTLTFMIYLNEGFAGGQTRFEDFGVDVVPRTGLALFFQHRLRHEGSRVESGVKYVLRSDVMYRAG
jgi:prolyl 4-hydroxylase